MRFANDHRLTAQRLDQTVDADRIVPDRVAPNDSLMADCHFEAAHLPDVLLLPSDDGVVLLAKEHPIDKLFDRRRIFAERQWMFVRV